MDTLESEVGQMFDLPAEMPEEETIETPKEEAQPQPEAPAETAEQPSAQPEEAEQPKTGEQPKDHHVPLATFLEEKLAAREAKRENADLKRQLEALQKPQEPKAIPDPYEDPQGYQSFVQTELQQQAFAMRAEMSGRFAEQRFGKEAVEQAIAWAQAEGLKDPTLGQRVNVQQSPVEWIVEQHQREQFFQKYGSDPSALSQAPASAAAPQTAVAPVIASPKQAPPRSLASAPSTGAGHQAVPTGSVLDSLKFNLD